MPLTHVGVDERDLRIVHSLLALHFQLLHDLEALFHLHRTLVRVLADVAVGL